MRWKMSKDGIGTLRSVIVIFENRHGAHGGGGDRVFRNFESRARDDDDSRRLVLRVKPSNSYATLVKRRNSMSFRFM